MFEIHLGIPEMEELWNSLQKKHQDGNATINQRPVGVRLEEGHLFRVIIFGNIDMLTVQ